MSFKYINPGYANLFDSFPDSISKETTSDTSINPENGVSISISSGAGDIDVSKAGRTIFIKFDMYCTDRAGGGRGGGFWQLKTAIGPLFTISALDDFPSNYRLKVASPSESIASSVRFSGSKVYHIFIAVSYDTAYNISVYTLDDNGDKTLILNTSYSKRHEPLTICEKLYTSNSYAGIFAYISNIIISTEDCSRERVQMAEINTSGNIDAEALNLRMTAYTTTPQITSVQVVGTEIDKDENNNAITEIIDGIKAEQKKYANATVLFSVMDKAPTGDTWTIAGLKNNVFKLEYSNVT